jgi:NAD(P)-dependent dehydrogenase (short-subunit alcohol dehydrogenase family)
MSIERKLERKVIVVAGAGGIGSGLALRYAGEGASVVLGDLDGAAARATAEAIEASGGRAVGTELDGADDGSIKAAVDLAVSRFGGLDGFHANFACFDDGADDVLGLSMEVYDEVMRVNARGFVLCTRHAVPAMLARGGGSIVYTSSGAAHAGLPMRLAYSMSKTAGHALMRHVARRFGPDGIRANVIAPGAISHARFESVFTPEQAKAMVKDTPINNRLGSPNDIAAMGALLMSDDGSYITGQVICVDGGSSMRP